MTLLLPLVSVALAGWTPNGTENGCTFFLGSQENGMQPVRAECDWPIAASRLQRAVAATADHDKYFDTVEECDVLGAAPGGGELVRQVHVATGMSDREATLVFTRASISGGTRYSWALAAQQRPTERVPVRFDTGFWEITDNGRGGSRVVYELRYDPGGSVPSVLVRWFQGSGVKQLVGELRSWVEKNG
jgi:hypothetical protein